MSETKAPRPPQVGSACLFVGLLSGLMLFYVVGWLTSWNSLEQQQVVADIAEAVGTSQVERLSSALRVALLVIVVLLVAGTVGAIFAFRADRSSRVLVTVVAAVGAVMFVVGGGLIGLIPAVFAISSIVQLWSKDANRWYALRNGLPVKDSWVRPEPVAAASVEQLQGATPTSPVPPPPPPTALPHAPEPPGGRRPSAVSTATLVTVLATAAALSASVLFLLVTLLIPTDDLVEAQLQSPVYDMFAASESDLRDAIRQSAVYSAIAAVLSVAALVAAWLFHRGRKAGHVALTVLAVVTVIFGTFTIIGIPWAGAAIWVLVLLRRRETVEWLARQSTTDSSQI